MSVPLTPDEIRRAIDLYVHDECSLAEVARELGRERTCIRQMLIRYGIPLRSQREAVAVLVRRREAAARAALQGRLV